MIRYFNEEDENMNIDVQVGPKTDVSVSADPEEAVPGAKGDDENDVKGIVNPVALAKAGAENIPVAAIPCDHGDAKCEFYVDLGDVVTYANINEMGMVDALNSIIEHYSDDGMTANNLVVVCYESESGIECAQQIDEAGGNCLILGEAEDITMKVQVGPNGEEVDQSTDPQYANPVDGVKRQYNNVVVAQKGDDFFVDVEDVQKCADLNCESVITTLNNVIACNEDSGLSADNLIVLCDENASKDLLDEFETVGVKYAVME